MDRAYFRAIERSFGRVLNSLDTELSAAERREVAGFIEVGEYGVALETLSALLVEEDKRITAAILAEIVGLAATMGIDHDAATKQLERLVVST